MNENYSIATTQKFNHQNAIMLWNWCWVWQFLVDTHTKNNNNTSDKYAHWDEKNQFWRESSLEGDCIVWE